MGNYTKGRADERVTLEEFLIEVKKTYDLSPKAAESAFANMAASGGHDCRRNMTR